MTDPDHLPSGEPDHDRLRALLEDAVADVQPAPALDRIRARTKVTPMRSTRNWLFVTAGAVAATAVTIAAVSLADGRSPQADPSPGPAPATTTATPTEVSTPDPSPDQSSGPAATAALPVYFVGDTPTGPRLYREFLPPPAGTADEDSARLLAALELAVGDYAVDPDYRSSWPSGFAVVGAGGPGTSSTGSAVPVALDADVDLGVRPAGMSGTEARTAVQQLVYTAQAVLQVRQPVEFTSADGVPLTRLLGLDVSDPVAEADAHEVQAPVWVISPQDGQEVGRTFTAEGRGAFFEATVSWQLLEPDGRVVKDGFATAQECCTLSPYSFEVTAPPGDYVLRVYDADMSGGEGPGEQEDTKEITVR